MRQRLSGLLLTATLMVVSLALTACGTGQLPSTVATGGSSAPVGSAAVTVGSIDAVPKTAEGEPRSTTCVGLTVDRQFRIDRIIALDTVVAKELSGPPATVVYALKRMSGPAEQGTLAYDELATHRSELEADQAAMAKLNCAVAVAAKSP